MERFPLALILLMSLLLTPAIARNDVSATYADVRAETALTLRQLEPLAEAGDVVAAYQVGLIYNNGDGVDQNFSEAVSWFSLAAAQDYAPAQYRLGIKYEKGQGVQRNYVEAVRWYNDSATRGHANAQYRLGRMYAQGLGVKLDYMEAIKWFDLASAQGAEDAGAARKAVASVLATRKIAEIQNEISAKPTTQSDIELLPPDIKPNKSRAGQMQSNGNSVRGGANAYKAAGYRSAHELWSSLAAIAPGSGMARSEEIVGIESPLAATSSEVKNQFADADNALWRIQLVSLRSQSDTQAAWTRLQQANPHLLDNLTLHVQSVRLSNGTFYRVQAGPIMDKTAATSICKALKSRNQDCLVVAPLWLSRNLSDGSFGS